MTREKCSRSEHEFEFLLYDGLRQALMALMDWAIDVPHWLIQRETKVEKVPK